MKKGDGDEQQHRCATSKLRVVHEFDFFDENRTGPTQSYTLSPPMNRRLQDHDEEEEKRNGSIKRNWENIAPLFLPRAVEEIEEHEIRPRFVRRVVAEIEEHQLALLFEKKLEFCDVGQRQNQLLIGLGGSERVMAALTEEERWKLEKEGFLEVDTIDPRGNNYKMRLKHMGAISHEWFKLVSANQLEEGETVQGWGFRQGQHFRLAINFIRNLFLT